MLHFRLMCFIFLFFVWETFLENFEFLMEICFLVPGGAGMDLGALGNFYETRIFIREGAYIEHMYIEHVIKKS